jgi:hypothetical protein
MQYSLDDLGWYEFEQLIQTLLKIRFGFGIEAWGGRGDWGCDAYFLDSLKYPTTETSPGPFIFQCKFVESANAAGAKPESLVIKAVKKECELIVDRLKPGGKWSKRPTHYALFTNAPIKPDTREKIQLLLGDAIPGCQVHLHDGNDVCQWLNTAHDIVRRFPQLLSIRDLNEFLRECVNADIIARSQTAIVMAEAQAKVFIPTRPYYEALQRLQKHFFVVLEGPPEMGKTTIGRVIALTQLSRDWEAIECRQPEDFLKMFHKERSQVFVVDDFFGRTEYDPSRVSLWQADLPHILHCLDSQHWLILTSRAHLLEMAKANLDVAGLNDRFPALGEVIVNAGDLTNGEKARMLYRHAKAAQMSNDSKSIIKQQAKGIVLNKHFTPERIRRLVVNVIPSLSASTKQEQKRLETLVAEAISNPTKEMRVSFHALPTCHRWLLYALLESEDQSQIIRLTGGITITTLQQSYEVMCPPEDYRPFDSVAKEMSEAFVTQTSVRGYGKLISWIHPSCRDLTIEELSSSTVDRLRFLGLCSETGIHLATSVGGGEKGERRLPLLQNSKDWKVLKVRCIEFAHKPENILRRLWQNLKLIDEQTKNIAALAPAAMDLRRFIEKDLLPATSEFLSNKPPHSYMSCLETFFEVRRVLSAHVAIDLTKAWKICVENAKDGLPEDRVIWDCASGPNGFLQTVNLIEDYEPSFLENRHFKNSFIDVIRFFRDRGESEVVTVYSDKLADDEIGNAVGGYANLCEAFTGLSELEMITAEDSKSFEKISSHFDSEANSLQEQLPGEPDYDGSGSGAHSSGEMDVSELFKDL